VRLDAHHQEVYQVLHLSKARRTLVGVTALSTLGLGLILVASPPAGASSNQASSARHHTARLCDATPARGYASCMAVRQTDVKPQLAAVTPAGLGPADLQSAYNLPSGGSGQTVAIVDAYDDPNAEADLAVYRSTYGLPACTTASGCFSKVNQDGAASPLPAPDAGWAGEISLDLDMVSATCPSCNILLVEADTPTMDNLGTAVNAAVTLGAKYVSNSYGGSEDSSIAGADSQYFDHPGVAITASTGDSGYGASYPATGAHVTAVGGTSLTQDGSTRGWSETAWSGAGSGCSAVIDQPSFQAGVDTGCSSRAEADVSAVADPQTGVAVYDTYQEAGWNVYGGTSASAPIIASVYALAGSPGSAANADPYANPSALNDVTSGSNGSCSAPVQCEAGPGWDGPTGLGTPNGTGAFTG
jgi:subtilase family serine protease